jgi:hypothetical protein
MAVVAIVISTPSITVVVVVLATLLLTFALIDGLLNASTH